MTAVSNSRIAVLGLVLLLCSCSKPGRQSKSGHPLPPSPLVVKGEPGQVGGRLTLALEAGPVSFNPLLAFDEITRLLYGSLVNAGPAMPEPGPGLAESWSVAPDQKTWTFKLREGVRWSDGTRLTADDVVFTWNQIMYNPECNRATYELFRIGGKSFEVTTVDDFTVRVVTPEVFAPFLEFFGSVAILPRHALENAVRQRRFPLAYSTNTPPERIIGCGPYRVKEFRPGRFTLLERNPEYWVADSRGRRLPYFDEVMFTVGNGPGAEAALFLNGKSDACDTVRPENNEAFRQGAAQGRFQFLELGFGAERDFLWFNQNTGVVAGGKLIVNPVKLKWFRNKKFRQAISCALDRDRLVREAYAGRAQPIYSFMSTENPKWNNPNVPRYGHDLARARALLAEAGIADRDGSGAMKDAEGNPIEIVLVSNSENALRQKATALIQDDLKKLGIKLVCVPLDFRSLVEKINFTCDYECALMGLGGGGLDPASQMNVLRSSEDLHQWFPRQQTPSTDWEARIDSLMDAQMRTLDFAQRKKDFDEVQVILAEELPMIYTVAPFACAAIRSDLGNVRPSVLTPFRVTWNLEELYFKGQRSH
jgi:peptide/nickel transport system substrate-binding protein